MLDLVTVGEAFDDVIFYDVAKLPAAGRELKTDRFVKTIGGGVVITAVAAARLGLRCGAVSALSAEAAARLRREGVTVRNVGRASEPTALTVAVSNSRDRRFVTFTGVNDRLPRRLRQIVPRLRARHIHFVFEPRPCHPWIRIVHTLRQRGITTSWDFGWNPALARDRDLGGLCVAVDVLFLNDDEARLYGTRSSWRAMPHPVVIKLGPAGARIVGAGLDVRAVPPRARVVDTTGAGDVFNAGFLTATLRGKSVRRALTDANRLAAKSTERVGGL